MTEQKEEYPYVQYEKSLEHILEQLTKSYWTEYIDINRHQMTVIKNYLWISAAMLGAHSAFITFFLKEKSFDFNVCSILFMLLAILFATVGFGLCLYAMPGRNGYRDITDFWKTWIENAHKALEQKFDNVYRLTLVEMVENFSHAAEHGLATNNVRAKILRKVSWLLIIAFVFSVLTVTTIVIHVVLHNLGV